MLKSITVIKVGCDKGVDQYGKVIDSVKIKVCTPGDVITMGSEREVSVQDDTQTP